MARVTLDELLDATGVDRIAGTHLKTASAVVARDNFSKLADLCRKAAEATPEEQNQERAQSLAEKTAAVEIIRRTLAEIRAIDGDPPPIEKTASAGFDQAIFIKSAIDEGHSPEDIARFIDELVSKRNATEETRRKTGTTMIS